LIYICELKDKSIYISKRSLKHFVESRSGELFDRYDYDFISKRLYFIIDNIENVIYNHDLCRIENGRYYFSKDFSYVYMPIVRIVLECVGGHFEIVTMHYKKTKNTIE